MGDKSNMAHDFSDGFDLMDLMDLMISLMLRDPIGSNNNHHLNRHGVARAVL